MAAENCGSRNFAAMCMLYFMYFSRTFRVNYGSAILRLHTSGLEAWIY